MVNIVKFALKQIRVRTYPFELSNTFLFGSKLRVLRLNSIFPAVNLSL